MSEHHDAVEQRLAPDRARRCGLRVSSELVSKAFTPGRIEQLSGQVEGVCEELLSTAPSGRPFDLVADYALPLPLTIIGELLGIPPSDRQRFHVLLRGCLTLGLPTGGPLHILGALPYFWLLTRYYRRLFAERRQGLGQVWMCLCQVPVNRYLDELITTPERFFDERLDVGL